LNNIVFNRIVDMPALYASLLANPRSQLRQAFALGFAAHFKQGSCASNGQAKKLPPCAAGLKNNERRKPKHKYHNQKLFFFFFYWV